MIDKIGGGEEMEIQSLLRSKHLSKRGLRHDRIADCILHACMLAALSFFPSQSI